MLVLVGTRIGDGQMRKIVLLAAAFTVFAGATAIGTAGSARAASDDAVDPSFYNPGGQACAPRYPKIDPLGGWGGAPGLTAYIMPANAGCNTAIWSDYSFTRGRTCSVDIYVSGSANANVTYHFELDNTANDFTVSLDQDPFYGWIRILPAVYSIRTVWMDDQTYGNSKQYIGAAGMDFTCH
jgi:hypothetical protein